MKEKPVVIHGITCYASHLSRQNEYFPADKIQEYSQLVEGNFWYNSRNNIIKHLFSTFVGSKSPKKVLEVGCGTGVVIKNLTEFQNYALTGADVHIDYLIYNQKNFQHVHFIQMDIMNIPFEASYDAIGAFDVLEHIEDDETVMQNIHKALVKGGYFILSVPQHQFLWSVTDDMQFHKRRYAKKNILKKLRNNGFAIRFVTSYMFMLFPVLYVSRWIDRMLCKFSKHDVKPVQKELNLHPVINFIFSLFTKMDEIFIQNGKMLPFGGSLIIVAQKDSQ